MTTVTITICVLAAFAGVRAAEEFGGWLFRRLPFRSEAARQQLLLAIAPRRLLTRRLAALEDFRGLIAGLDLSAENTPGDPDDAVASLDILIEDARSLGRGL